MTERTILNLLILFFGILIGIIWGYGIRKYKP